MDKLHISAEVGAKKNKKAVKQAKDGDVYVVNEEFLEASKKGGAALFIKSHSLCDWGSDVSSLLVKRKCSHLRCSVCVN